MNTKEMITSIVTAMMVMTMFASSAMAITVDGEIDPANEWDDYDEMIVDTDPSEYPVCSNGYNITSLWMRVDGDTLFVRIDVAGVAGDADNDNNPDTHTEGMSCSCGWDYVGVGVGADDPSDEEYIATIDGNNDGINDYHLRYQLGNATLYSCPDTLISGATTDAAHGNIVELSVKIDPDYCYIDPANYCVEGSADTDCNGNEDPVDTICYSHDPPVAEFDFTPTVCGGGTLDASASSDDVVSWDWDFCDDGTGDYDDASGESVEYAYPGTCNVGLQVTNSLGQTNTTRHDVTVAGSPIVQVTTDADGCVDIGSTVEFSIYSIIHDTPIASYQWTFDDGLTGSSDTSPTTSRTIPISGVTATLKVVDTLGCMGVDSVSVCAKPPQQVPILTPAGMVALIGMLCIVGGGRILTKGRRS